jgi:hypothetical protein
MIKCTQTGVCENDWCNKLNAHVAHALTLCSRPHAQYVNVHARYKDARKICTGDYETLLRKTRAFEKVAGQETAASGKNWNDVLQETLDAIWRQENPDGGVRDKEWTPKCWLVFTTFFMGQEDSKKRARALMPNPKRKPNGGSGRTAQRERNAGVKLETGEWPQPDARAEAVQISAIQQHHQVQLQQVAGDQEHRNQRVEELKTLMTYDPGNKETYVQELVVLLQNPGKGSAATTIEGAAASLASGITAYRSAKRAKTAVKALASDSANDDEDGTGDDDGDGHNGGVPTYFD